MGAVLGKTTYMQLVFMGILELVMFTVNKYVGEHLLMVSSPRVTRLRARHARSSAAVAEQAFPVSTGNRPDFPSPGIPAPGTLATPEIG